MSTKTEATVEDLYRIQGKAEIVNGEIVLMSPTGDLPSSAALEIAVSLRVTLDRLAPAARTVTTPDLS